MNTAIKDKTKEKVFSKAVNIAYKKIKKDPQKGMMDIVDVFDEYLLPKSGEVNSGKVGLERIRN